MHLDGCVEVEAAYYSAPPGWIGRRVEVQWDALHVRLLDPNTGQLLREHLRQKRGRHRIKDEDRPKKTPLGTVQLLARAERPDRTSALFARRSSSARPRPPSAASRACFPSSRKYGAARVEEACAAALEMQAYDYRFVRRYLERNSTAAEPAASRSAHPSAHCTVTSSRTNQQHQEPTMKSLNYNVPYVNSGWAAWPPFWKHRLHQAQAEPMAPIDLISCLISDELTRRSDRLLERRRKQAGFRDPNRRSTTSTSPSIRK